jgi:tRNA(Ile)-lysidine synthase
MLEQVEKTLKEDCLVDPTKPLVVGVSGGPDSLSLIYVLKQLGFSSLVAHLNHGLRSDAEEDAGFVRETAEDLGLHFFGEYKDTNAFAERMGLALEETARQLRYQFLFDIAEKEEAQAVVVGHNADDQVETVLMHLIRGAGLSGLRGMQTRVVIPSWHQHIPLVRPLLGVWREEVMAYCQQHGLRPRFDRSNLDTTYFRNRLRHELIPELESYNPRIRDLIWRMASTLNADHEVIEEVIDQYWETCIDEIGDGYVILNRAVFCQQLIGVQRGITRRAITILRPGMRDIDFGAIERALTFTHHPPATRQSDLIAGLRIQIEGNLIWIADWNVEVNPQEWPQVGLSELKLKIPGEVVLGNNWHLRAEILPAGEERLQQVFKNPDPFVGWFDADVFTTKCVIRTRRRGDRFHPLGMGEGTIKLADFFINVKLPQSARKGWPLVCVGEQIAWVPGYRIGHPFRVTADTKELVKLHLFKGNPK